MIKVKEMREAGDVLLKHSKYREAFIIYEGLLSEILGTISVPQKAQKIFEIKSIKSKNSWFPFHEKYINSMAEVLCLRVYDATLAQILDELVKIILGHLECVCLSVEIRKKTINEDVLLEFLILYMLINQPFAKRKIACIFSYVTIILDKSNRMKRIRFNYSQRYLKQLLLENAENNKDTEWRSINSLLLEYVNYKRDFNNDFYMELTKIVGTPFRNFRNRQKYYNWDYGNNRCDQDTDKKSHYNHSSKWTYGNSNFCLTTATDAEKDAYYANIIKIKGKVTKTEIRDKYLQLISQYHPDKVQHLGPELRELAEIKSKEINAAYEWFKSRYKI